MSKTTETTAPTFWATIFVGGELAEATRICRSFCSSRGLCVTVEPVEYVYKGGTESGVRIGLINYPRFPSNEDAIREHALALAEWLREDLCQHSYSVMTPVETTFVSYRAD